MNFVRYDRLFKKETPTLKIFNAVELLDDGPVYR